MENLKLELTLNAKFVSWLQEYAAKYHDDDISAAAASLLTSWQEYSEQSLEGAKILMGEKARG